MLFFFALQKRDGEKKFINLTTEIVIISVTGLSISLVGTKKIWYTKNQKENNKINFIKKMITTFYVFTISQEM